MVTVLASLALHLAELPVRWLQIAMIGLPMMLLVIAIPVTAKSTMACV